jgi:hypothetical protein
MGCEVHRQEGGNYNPKETHEEHTASICHGQAGSSPGCFREAQPVVMKAMHMTNSMTAIFKQKYEMNALHI